MSILCLIMLIVIRKKDKFLSRESDNIIYIITDTISSSSLLKRRYYVEYTNSLPMISAFFILQILIRTRICYHFKYHHC